MSDRSARERGGKGSPRAHSPEGIASTLIFLVLIAVVLGQVASRSSHVPSVVWTEESARWLWVWLALLGIAEVERTGGHLRMTFLLDLAPAGLRKTVEIVFDLVWLAALAQLVLVGWSTVERTARNQAVTLPVSDAVLYAASLVGAVLIGLRVAMRLYGRLVGSRRSAT